MVTTVVNNAYLAINEQSGVRRPQNAPLLLFLIAQGIQEQQEFLFVNQLASLIGQQVEQRVLISAAPHSYCSAQTGVANTCCERLSAMIIGWLNQGVRRLLLAPWGCRHMTTTLIEAISSALSTASGEKSQ